MGRSTVPVIAVFTEYDQFRLSIEMNLEDHGCSNSESKAPTMNLCERSILLYEHPRLHQHGSASIKNRDGHGHSWGTCSDSRP